MSRFTWFCQMFGLALVTAVLVGVMEPTPAMAEMNVRAGRAEVTTQEELEEAVKRNDVDIINVCGEWEEFVAPVGDYSNKWLRLDNDSSRLTVEIPKGAKYDRIALDYTSENCKVINNGTVGSLDLQANRECYIEQNGKLDDIDVSGNAEVVIRGKADCEILVSVVWNSRPVKIDTDKCVHVVAYGDIEAVLRQGAEGSAIDSKDLKTTTHVINETSESVAVVGFDGDIHTVKAGREYEFYNEIPVTEELEVNPDNWDKYSSKLIYNTLSDDQKSLYDSIIKELDKYLFEEPEYSGSTYYHYDGSCQWMILISKPSFMSNREVLEVMNLVDTSKYYFIDQESQGYAGYYGNLEPEYEARLNGIYKNGEYRKYKTARIEEEMDEWVSEINSKCETAYDKLKYLHDKICDEAKPIESGYFYRSRTLFAGESEIDEKGYTRTFCTIANGLGIDSFDVRIDEKEWARVYIDGQWKFVDCYADDKVYEHSGKRCYDYFLVDVQDEPTYDLEIYEEGEIIESETVSYEYIFDMAIAQEKKKSESSAEPIDISSHEFKAIEDCITTTAYNKLSKEEKKFYKVISKLLKEYLTTDVDYHDGAYDHSTYDGQYYEDNYYIVSIDKPDYLTDEQFCRTVTCFDWSKYYFVCDFGLYYYTYGCEDGYYKLGISMYAEFADGKKRMEATKELQGIVDELVTEILTEAGNNPEKQLRLLHNRLCAKSNYEYKYLESPYVVGNFGASAYGILCGQDGKCTGYATAFDLVANALGFKVLYVTGASHAWNVVKLGKTWYVVDCTWDDQNKGFKYDNYLVSDDSHMAGHGYYPSYYDYSTGKTIKLDDLIPICEKNYKKK